MHILLSNQSGLYTQGIYRKSAGASSKKAVRTALEEGKCVCVCITSLICLLLYRVSTRITWTHVCAHTPSHTHTHHTYHNPAHTTYTTHTTHTHTTGMSTVVSSSKDGQYGTSYKIVPETTQNFTNRITCFKIPGMQGGPVMPQGVLPDTTNFTVSTLVHTVM